MIAALLKLMVQNDLHFCRFELPMTKHRVVFKELELGAFRLLNIVVISFVKTFAQLKRPMMAELVRIKTWLS